MTLPTYQNIYQSMLSATANGAEYSILQIREILAKELALSDDDLRALLPCGTMRVWDSRVGWCKTYLVKAGLLSQPKRGFVKITDRGHEVLKENPTELNDKYLLRYPEFRAFYAPGSNGPVSDQEAQANSSTAIAPDESMEFSYQHLRKEIESDILDRVLSRTPDFFEQLVVDLLVKMGYGGSRLDVSNSLIGPGKVVGKSGDGGIDGVIKEDKLGLDTLYIQAKKWSGTVGRPEVQKFAGALHGQRSRKGVMITTGTFSAEASEYVKGIEMKIALIDGKELATLMYDYNLGCNTHKTFEIKVVDGDYFEPELQE